MTRKSVNAIGIAVVIVGGLVAGGVFLIRGPCDQLVTRYCACDMQFPENRRGCELARDSARRTAAAEKVRARGKTLDSLCREKLDAFDCPDRAAPEFYPGGFSFYE